MVAGIVRITMKGQRWDTSEVYALAVGNSNISYVHTHERFIHHMGSDRWDASKGLAQNPMFKHALRRFRGGRFTHAGRALTKHPNIIGARDAAELAGQFDNQHGINKAAADALKSIMRNGTRVTKRTKAYGNVMEFKLPNGLGVRFNAITNEFIGFLGRGI